MPLWRSSLEVGGAALAIVAVLSYLNDRQAREEAIVNSAWGLVAAAKEEETGNVGLISALETLHVRGIDLSRANLPGAYLRELQLPHTNLGDSDLSKADLFGADLRGANLSEAGLRGTDLSEANLFAADLRQAFLFGANLRGANLYDADLPGADLSEANRHRQVDAGEG